MKYTVTIIESGMSFGEFDPERIFHIEDSNLYRKLGTSIKGIRIRFVLVIKNAEESWLTGVQTELERRLLSTRKIWDADVMVLNEDFALRKNLIAVNQNKGEKNT